MKTIALTQDGRDLEPSECCSVAFIYEDASHRETALRLTDILRQQFGDDLEFQFTWWGFKYLSDARLAENAATDVSMADVILFSMHAAAELPATVRRWIEGWCGTPRENGGALATLLEPARETQPLPALSYLRNVAMRAGLDFLPLKSANLQIPTRISPAMILSPRNYPVSHWGINE